jgi:excisionase family DNA binding protein
MRRPSTLQREQLRDIDPLFQEFFTHVHAVVDVLQQIMLRPPAIENPKHETAPARETQALIPIGEYKLSYTIKEVCKYVGVGHSTLYKVIGNRKLRTVKLGNKTLILAKDLQEWLDSLPSSR